MSRVENCSPVSAQPPPPLARVVGVGGDPGDLKARGCVAQRQSEVFTVRVRTPMGRLTSENLRAIAECADRFGSGGIHLTVRQTAEILDVPRNMLGELLQALDAGGLSSAAAGPVVRAVSGCSGCEVTPNGLVDCQAIGLATDARFFGIPCPSKFKITFAGCPTDCVRAKGADLGFVGVVEPQLISDRCTGCGICVATCREAALTEDGTGLPVRDSTLCVGCSHCVDACPSGALRVARRGLAVYVGGKHGRHPLPGARIASLLPETLVAETVERTIAWYQNTGLTGRPRERLGEPYA